LISIFALYSLDQSIKPENYVGRNSTDWII